MRDKQLLRIFLALNLALAACFVVYLVLSSNSQPSFIATTFPAPTIRTNVFVKVVPAETVVESNAVPAAGITNSIAVAPINAPALPIQTNSQAAASLKKFDWQQMQADEQNGTAEYKAYLDSLRVAGCPEDKIRYITLTDINELFAKKRLKEAVTYDTKWWRSELETSVGNVLQEKGRSLEEERRVLITKYLGAEAAEAELGEAMLWSNTQLTGPVLGNLSTEVHNAVQEIYSRSQERFQNAQLNQVQAPNAVEAARLRERTRADLRKVLKPEEMEEFLLRYSQNARALRDELRGFNPTPAEFRAIFRATDPMDHQVQLEYGSLNALSQQQRERHQVQREAAIKEVLGAGRFQDYLMVRDPLFEKAYLTALRYGVSNQAVVAIYQLTKTNDLRRQQILSNTALAGQQKTDALDAVRQEEIRGIQQIVSGIKGGE